MSELGWDEKKARITRLQSRTHKFEKCARREDWSQKTDRSSTGGSSWLGLGPTARWVGVPEDKHKEKGDKEEEEEEADEEDSDGGGGGGDDDDDDDGGAAEGWELGRMNGNGANARFPLRSSEVVVVIASQRPCDASNSCACGAKVCREHSKEARNRTCISGGL